MLANLALMALLIAGAVLTGVGCYTAATNPTPEE